MIMLCLLVAIAAPPADVAQALVPSLPVSVANQRSIRRAAAAMSVDRLGWVVWYQSPSRPDAYHIRGQDVLDPSEGVYCTLVDSLGRQVLARFRVASPSSLRAAECWGSDPLLTEALAMPDGRLLLLMREKTAEGYDTGYTYDLNGPDYVHPVGRVSERTRVTVVGRDDRVTSSLIPFRGEQFSFPPSTSSKQEWTCWDSSGRLHLFALSREPESGRRSSVHAVVAITNQIHLVSLDSTFGQDTAVPTQVRPEPDLDWMRGDGVHTAIAMATGDTALVVTLQASAGVRRPTGPADALQAVRIPGRSLKATGGFVVPVAEIAGKDYDTPGPERAVLLKAAGGFIFFCNYLGQLATFYLDAAGNPIPGPRSPATIVDGPTAGVSVTHVIELPWVASGLAPGRCTVVWYGLTSNGDVYRSIAGDPPPSRPPWRD